MRCCFCNSFFCSLAPPPPEEGIIEDSLVSVVLFSLLFFSTTALFELLDFFDSDFFTSHLLKDISLPVLLTPDFRLPTPDSCLFFHSTHSSYPPLNSFIS